MCTPSLSRVLKYLCTSDNRNTPLPSDRRRYDSGEDLYLLHTSFSSRSSLGGGSSMETLFQQSLQEMAAHQYFVPEENPEAMFDMLTIQTLRDRYQDDSHEDVGVDLSLINADEFESFVRDFPIDDSISECFASSDNLQTLPSEINATSAASEAATTNSQNKLKKKHKNNHEETVFSDEESKSSDSKKSKLISNLFGRKQKNKEDYKALKQTDKRDSSDKDITNVIIDACENITKSYEVTKPATSSSSSETRDKHRKHKKRNETPVNREPSVIQNDKLYGDSGRGDVGKNAVHTTRKLPPVPPRGNVGSQNGTGKDNSEVTGYAFVKKDVNSLLSLSDDKLIENLRTILSHSNCKTGLRSTVSQRLDTGVTFMQKLVMDDRANVIDFILDEDPSLLDSGLMTFAVKNGKIETVRDMLERKSMDGTLNPGHVGELIAICSQRGQPHILESIIPYLDMEPPSVLPCDESGNTAAHIAARQGHLHCIQVLLDNGFDIWTLNDNSENVLKLALDNGHHSIYKHLLLYQTCQCLLMEATEHKIKYNRLLKHRSTSHEVLEQLEQQLAKYQIQFNDVMRSTIDAQESILQSLDNVYKDTKRLVQKVDKSDATEKLKLKLEKLKAEADQLQDLFDFSPLANTNDLLTKVLLEFRKVVESAKMVDNQAQNVEMPADATDLLSMMLRNSVTVCGQQNNTNVEQILSSQVHNLLQTLCDTKRTVSKSTSSVSSRSGNYRYQFSQPVYSNPNLKTDHDSEHKSPEQFIHEKKSDSSQVEAARQIVTDSGIIFRNVSDPKKPNFHSESETEASDLPVLESPSATDSVCSTVVTSGIMGTEKTDWTSRLGTITCDTSDTESDWWDESHDKSRSGYTESREDDYDDDDTDIVTSIRLNLENEDLPDDVLRQHRLTKHLQSVEKINCDKGDFIERVISANGRRVGRWLDSSCLNETQKSKQNSKSSSKTKRHGIQLFGPDKHVIENRRVNEILDRDRRWEELSITDGEENRESARPWYEMSDDEESILQGQGWKSDDDDSQPVYRI